jgi:hypothetical protein
VVAVLLGQTPEQMATIGAPVPPVLVVDPEQDVGHGQGQQLGVAGRGRCRPPRRADATWPSISTYIAVRRTSMSSITVDHGRLPLNAGLADTASSKESTI